MSRGVWRDKRKGLPLQLFTDHEVCDERKHCVGQEPERQQVGEQLGDEEGRHPVVATGILMTAERRGGWQYLHPPLHFRRPQDEDSSHSQCSLRD